MYSEPHLQHVESEGLHLEFCQPTFFIQGLSKFYKKFIFLILKQFI